MDRNPKLLFVIRRTRFFRGREELRDLVADENGDAIKFNGSKAARAQIAMLRSGGHTPDSRETSPPEYSVFRLDQLPEYLVPYL